MSVPARAAGDIFSAMAGLTSEQGQALMAAQNRLFGTKLGLGQNIGAMLARFPIDQLNGLIADGFRVDPGASLGSTHTYGLPGLCHKPTSPDLASLLRQWYAYVVLGM